MTNRDKLNFIESIADTASGFIISNLIAYFILPYRGFRRSIANSIEVTTIFTIVGVIRNFSIRTIFDRFKYRSLYNTMLIKKG